MNIQTYCFRIYIPGEEIAESQDMHVSALVDNIKYVSQVVIPMYILCTRSDESFGYFTSLLTFEVCFSHFRNSGSV